MQTLQKPHLSTRLHIEQVACYLLMLLLSPRACCKAEISLFFRYLLIEARLVSSQLICLANWLTVFFVMRKVHRFHLISGLGDFRWAHGFCIELTVN